MEDEKKVPDLVTNPQAQDIPPGLIDTIKQQVVAEMQNDKVRKVEEARIRQQKQKEDHDKYVAQMKASPDPWVEILGEADTPQGLKIELEWNDAFVEMLKKEGITGANEDQIVQKWIALLMHDMSSKMDDETNTEYE